MSADSAKDETCCFNVRRGVRWRVEQMRPRCSVVQVSRVIWGVPFYQGKPLHMAAELPNAIVSTLSHHLP